MPLMYSTGDVLGAVKGFASHLMSQLPGPINQGDCAGVERGMSSNNPAPQRQGSSLDDEWESDDEGSGNESHGEVPKTKGSWRGGEDDLLVR